MIDDFFLDDVTDYDSRGYRRQPEIKMTNQYSKATILGTLQNNCYSTAEKYMIKYNNFSRIVLFVQEFVNERQLIPSLMQSVNFVLMSGYYLIV